MDDEAIGGDGFDWAQWSRDAAAMMQARNQEWMNRYGLFECPYVWSLDPPELVFRREQDEVVARLQIVGTTSRSAGTFLWSWANQGVPACASNGMETVRQFGQEHDLVLLTEGSSVGGRAEGLEIAALAGRILDAAGVFIDESDGVTLYFVLERFEIRKSKAT